MVTDLVQIRRLGEQKRKENEELRRHLKRHAIAERRLRNMAEEIENAIDCTVCANCCRVATARLTERDVEKLAKFFKVKTARVLAGFTERDQQEGLILKRTDKDGCVFLEGNLCTVYDARPATCLDFPHLVRGPGSLLSRLWEMPDRATYCPIAYNTLEAFKRESDFGAGKKRKGRGGAAANGEELAALEAPERVRLARIHQKRKGRGGAAANGEELAALEAPERVRLARIHQK